MVVKYWPAAAPREENASPFLVKQISRTSVDDYLKRGQRYTIRGITLYTKPTDILEVGFLIRRKAGNAVDYDVRMEDIVLSSVQAPQKMTMRLHADKEVLKKFNSLW